MFMGGAALRRLDDHSVTSGQVGDLVLEGAAEKSYLAAVLAGVQCPHSLALEIFAERSFL